MKPPRARIEVPRPPAVDRLASKLAQLMPRAPGLHRASADTSNAWSKEDAATIAGAYGSAKQGHGSRRYPLLLCTLRTMPEWRLTPADTRLLDVTTTGLLRQAYASHWAAMPARTRQQLQAHVEAGRLTALLHDELRHPPRCGRCRGHGEIVRTRDEAGNHVDPIIITCPRCNGSALGTRSYKVRAAALSMRAWTWSQHGQAHYASVLAKQHYLSDMAAAEVMRALSGK